MHGRLSSVRRKIRELFSAVHRERERRLKDYPKMQGLWYRIHHLEKELEVGGGAFLET